MQNPETKTKGMGKIRYPEMERNTRDQQKKSKPALKKVKHNGFGSKHF